MGKIMKNGVAYSSGSNGGSNASDIAYDSSNIISAPTVEGTQDNAAAALSQLGTASTKNVINSLSTWTPEQGVLDAYQGYVLNQKITAIGKYVTASGKYTTAQWTYGTTTCSLTIPSNGIWIVWGCFEMDDSAHRNMYRQFQMPIRGDGSSWLLGVNNIYYDATGSNSNDGIIRTICAPGSLKSGAVIEPYVHTGDVGVEFTVRMVALRIA